MTPAEKEFQAQQAKTELSKKMDAFKSSDAVKALTARGVTLDGAAELNNEPGAAVAGKIAADPSITRVYAVSNFENKAVQVGQKPDENIGNHVNAEYITVSLGKDAKKESPRKVMFVVQQDDLGNGHNGLAMSFLKDTLGKGDEVVVYVAIQDETKKGALTGNIFKDFKRATKKDDIAAAVAAVTASVEEQIAEFQKGPLAQELAAAGVTVKFDFESAPKRREATAAKILSYAPDRLFVVRKDKVGVELKDDMDDFLLGKQAEGLGKYDVILYRAGRGAREAAKPAVVPAVAQTMASAPAPATPSPNN
jgi:hypothetical protein